MKRSFLGVAVVLMALGVSLNATTYSIANTETAFANRLSNADSLGVLADGDTIILAAGTAVWSSGTTHQVNVGVTIAGAGSPTPITGSLPTTIIQCSFPFGGTGNKRLIAINCDGVARTEITGIQFVATNTTNDGTGSGFFDVFQAPGCLATRFDHCDFLAQVTGGNVNTGYKAIATFIFGWAGYNSILIDQNTFECGEAAEMIHANALSLPATCPTGSGPALADWGNAMNPQVGYFIENNIFTDNCLVISGGTASTGGTCAVQGYYGARIYFRFNTCNYTQVDYHGGGANGASPANVLNAPTPGTRWTETYNNNFIATTAAGANQPAWPQMGSLRAGTGVWYNNVLENNSGQSWDGGPPSVSMWQDWNGAQQTAGAAGLYPQLWQLGMGGLNGAFGLGSFTNSGSFPNVISTANTGVASSATNPGPQVNGSNVYTPVPFAFWANEENDSGGITTMAIGVNAGGIGSATYIQAGRDYNDAGMGAAGTTGTWLTGASHNYTPVQYPYPWNSAATQPCILPSNSHAFNTLSFP